MAQTKRKTGSTAKTSKARASQTTRNGTARKTTAVKKTAKKTEPIVIARTQNDNSWQPLVRSSRKNFPVTQTQSTSTKKKRGAKKRNKKNMTDSKLAAITISAVFGAIFLIVLLVFLFNAFDLKLW